MDSFQQDKAKLQTILFISYDGLTDALGQSQILSYLLHLTRPDRKIFIMAFEKKENYDRDFHHVDAIVKKAGIEWVKLWYHKKPPILSTIGDVRRGIKMAKALHNQYHFDIVHCRGHISGLIGLRVKGAKMIFDMRAWWADEKKDSGYWDSLIYKPIYRYFKVLEKKLFQKADYNISLTYAGKKEILAKRFSTESKIGVIPTCVNLSLFKSFDPLIRVRMRELLAIPQQSKVLIYSGGIGGNYDMPRMVKIFESFIAVYSEAFILILSKDAVPEDFLKLLQQNGIKKYLIKNVAHREVSDHLQAGDAGVVFYKPAYSNIGRSPTKLAEYWASGIPVISFKNIGDLEMLFERYPLGGVLCKEDMSDLTEKITELQFGHPRELRKAALEYFDSQRGVQFYDNVYKRFAETPSVLEKLKA